MRSQYFFICLCVLVGSLSNALADWHHPLSLNGGGYWRGRLPVEITNDGNGILEGAPVEVKISETSPANVLVGQEAEQIRVTNGAGLEMLYTIYGLDGQRIEVGPIPTGASIVLPFECEGNGSATYYIYFDNLAAGRLPDYLRARPGLVNGSIESGTGEAPVGWRHDVSDGAHRASWSLENPHSGKRCLKTIVAPGAEVTWIASRQSGIHIVGGARYRVEAWVRAENVKGYAGWYLHVGNSKNSMLVAPTLRAGSGTFGWKRVSHQFTAPVEATLLSLGTVLRGTGTAWFDDISLTCLEPGSVRTKVLPSERKNLTEVGGRADPVHWPKNSPDRRAVVRNYNFADEPRSSAMVSVDLEMIGGRARGRLNINSLRVKLGAKTIEHVCMGTELLFRSDVPARTVAQYDIYFADDASPGQSIETTATSSPLPNLVANGGFEQGRPLPNKWTTISLAESGNGVRFSVDNPGRKDLGTACARMDISDGLPESWRGWHQSVSVRPGSTYLLAAWLKCQGLSAAGEVRVHAHRRTADGGLSKTGAMTSIAHGITGTTDWTFTSELFTMPEDTTQFQIHLTTTASGTVWHDGVLLAEVTDGAIARFECRPMPSPETLTVWPVPSVVKVFPDDPAPDEVDPFAIAAARNEQEVIQLAVRSGRPINDLHVRVKPPVGPGGTRLPAPEVNIVGYVPIDYPTSYYVSDAPAWHRLIPTQRPKCDGWAGLWPDPLLPSDRLDLAADTTKSVWITIAVPENATAGVYSGTIQLNTNDGLVAEQTYTVRVWDFALPDENHVAAIYDLRYGPGGDQQWGAPLDEKYRELVRFLAKRRLSPDTIRPAPHIRYVDGRVEADFTAYDQAAEFYFDELNLPYAYTPWTFYLFGWGHPPKTAFGERPYEGEPPYEGADRKILRPQYKKAYQACLKVFWDHVKEKGWDNRIVLYISDEPHDWHDQIGVQMTALCEMIHEVDPAIPIYSSTWKHVPEWDRQLDVWGIGHDGRVPIDKMAEIRKAGDQIWFTTDGQMCTDTPYCAVERLLPHYCFKYGAQAYEFWGASWLTYDPYCYGWHSYIRQSSEPGKFYWIRYPNGDGFLIYPGEPFGQDEPISTIRLENAREGVEDYEYLYLLTNLTRQAKAAGRDVTQATRALAAAVDLVKIPNAGGRYSSKILPDPTELFRVREQVGRAIEELAR